MPAAQMPPANHELAAQVQKNFIAYFRHFAGLPGITFSEEEVTWIAGGSASTYNVSTPTVQRRRGFGGAVAHAALQVARDRGYRSTWIWSSPLGKSVYAGLGFVVTNFGIREYQWKKRV